MSCRHVTNILPTPQALFAQKVCSHELVIWCARTCLCSLRRGPCLPLAQNPLTCQHEADLLFLCARSCGYCDRDGHSFCED